MARAEELGSDELVGMLRQVEEVNHARRARIVRVAADAVGGSLAGQKIAVLGAAFKANTDDIRESPALAVAESLRAEGADVVVFDPQATDNARRARPLLRYAASAEEACQDAQAVVHLTDWPEFRALDPRELKPMVANAVLVDARLSLDAEAWRAAGWTYLP